MTKSFNCTSSEMEDGTPRHCEGRSPEVIQWRKCPTRPFLGWIASPPRGLAMTSVANHPARPSPRQPSLRGTPARPSMRPVIARGLAAKGSSACEADGMEG
jgi:hypothetical protein